MAPISKNETLIVVHAGGEQELILNANIRFNVTPKTKRVLQ
jgi:hypothetical protein